MMRKLSEETMATMLMFISTRCAGDWDWLAVLRCAR